MKVVSNRRPPAPASSKLEKVVEENLEDTSEQPKVKEEKAPLFEENLLSSDALDYLDEIIAMDEKAAIAQENDAPKPESPKRNDQAELPKEEEKSQILDP